MKRFIIGKPNGPQWQFDTIEEVEAFQTNFLEKKDPEGLYDGKYYLDDMEKVE